MKSHDGNDLSEDTPEINEDQYLAKNIQRSYSKDEIEIIDEKQLPEETMSIESNEHTCVDEDDFTNDKYDAEFNKADSEEIEEFDENDVSKSIQLVEAFKGQLYTFVGNCDKCFAQSNDLKKHTRTHTGEKAFQCEACGKGFNSGSNIKKHTKTHSDEKS